MSAETQKVDVLAVMLGDAEAAFDHRVNTTGDANALYASEVSDQARAAVAELIEAAKPYAENIPEDYRAFCHNGICSARECGRCSRAMRLYQAIARVGGAA